MSKKFLIIRFSSIGDIVLTSPVVRILKQQVADAEIHFVTKGKYSGLLTSNPNIDKVHVLNHKMSVLIQQLKREKFNYIIDLHNNIRSTFIKVNLGVPAFTFDKLNLKKWILVTFKKNYLPGVHLVDRYLDTLSGFGVTNDMAGLDFYIPREKRYDLSDLPESFREGYIAFVTGGTYLTKRLPADKINTICSKTPYPVILLGGRWEYQTGEVIAANNPEHVLNFCGKLDIHASASLIENARLVLTNDTGLMHIAAAFRKKILSFWGNTVESFGMYPYLPHQASKSLKVENLPCRPCSKIGYNKCPKGHFRCMKEIDTDPAVRWIAENY